MRQLGVGVVLLLCACGADDAPPGGDTDAGGPDAASRDAGPAAPDTGQRCSADGECDDGIFCNGIEQCEGGVCEPGVPIDCDDGLACTTDTCDEDAEDCTNTPADADGDGHPAASCGGDDCADDDVARYPGAAEVCDAARADEDCNPATFGDTDADRDGHVDAACCNGGSCGDDCDDTDDGVHPTEAEVCDGIDNNCDGIVDEAGTRTFYRDADADGRGDPTIPVTVTSCTPPMGYSLLAEDCDDSEPTTYFGAPEPCNGIDNDCSLAGPLAGGADPGEDGDGDMHAPAAHACTGGFLEDDCNDARADTFLGAAELCDGRDNDCSSGGGADVSEDADGDRHAPAGALCTFDGSAATFRRDDCDDATPTTYGGAPELCNRVDDDCTSGGGVDPTEDVDADGHAPVGGACNGGALPEDDCNDTAATIHPGAPELCDGLDNTCEGLIDGPAASAMCGAGTLCFAGICGRIEGIATGAELTCAVGGAGAVHRVMCFGSNWSGQLGLGYSSPRETRPLHVAGIDDAIGITAGENHACVLRAGGTVACWGRNDYGQLGDGTTMTRSRPVAVSGLAGVVQVEAGDFHTCARLADGTARCWGNNGAGAVGDGTTALTRATPVSVVGLTNLIDINAGGQHTCAVRMDGTAYCWGEQTMGRLGNGTAAPGVVRSPVPVSGLVDAVRIAAGLSHVCASRTTGEVVCWGSDSSGQIGRGGANDSTSVPAPVPGVLPSAVVTAYRDHTCSRPTTAMPARPVQCWGANGDGQIGDGSTLQADVPASVIGSTAFTMVSAGASHTCASDGASLSCWGRNGSGQLGDGTTDTRTTPTRVAL